MESNILIYIKGPPGSGKITTARLLQQKLGDTWSLLWIHDLDRILQGVVNIEDARRGKLRVLLDRVTWPILEHLLRANRNIIYVRPSRSPETVDAVKSLVNHVNNSIYRLVDRWSVADKPLEDVPDCRLCVVNLWASYETMVKRVEGREPSGMRIHSREELDEYLGARQCQINAPDECTVNTENTTPEEVVNRILWVAGMVHADGSMP